MTSSIGPTWCALAGKSTPTSICRKPPADDWSAQPAPCSPFIRPTSGSKASAPAPSFDSKGAPFPGAVELIGLKTRGRQPLLAVSLVAVLVTVVVLPAGSVPVAVYVNVPSGSALT